MAGKSNAENGKKPGSTSDELVDFSGMDGDDMVSLSDEELDNILNSAEITETPLADIDIDLDDDLSAAPHAAPAAVAPEPEPVAAQPAPAVAAPAVAGPAPGTPPAASPEGDGFFDLTEEETISISSSDLDSILDDASAPAPASLEAPVLGGDEDFLVGPPATTAPEELAGDDDDILMLEDEELVIEESDALPVEEPFLPEESFSAEEAEPSAPAAGSADIDLEVEEAAPSARPAADIDLDMEEISLEIDELTGASESAPAAPPAAPAEEEETPIITVSGNDLDRMVGVSAGNEPLDEFVLEEEMPEPQPQPQPQPAAVARIQDEPVILEEAPAPPDFRREAASSSFDQEEVVLDIDEEELITFEPVTEPDEEQGEVVFEEVPVAEEPAGEEIPVVAGETPPGDEPFEIIDDALIYSEEQKIPAAVAPPPQDEPVFVRPEAELISDEDISEIGPAAGLGQPEEVLTPVAGTVEGVPDGETVQGLPEETRENMKRILGYLDGLFEDLPEEKVKEFANSEYYDLYNKLFKELGI